ncbi:MAG: glycosyltransferase family 4 protein [Bacillota bacterium]
MIDKKVLALDGGANITVLLLTTEYGDKIIGGLGRHVNDLTVEGTKRGIVFIVVTVSQTHEESYRVEDGVHVFRLLPWQRKSKDFLEYILNVNFRFLQFILQELHLSFDLIHAHDWLTGIAGGQLKTIMNLPLLSTIHATEIGRKQGEINQLIKRITDYEKNLVHSSDKVIVCSLFMKNVLKNEFSLPMDRIEVIPNGIIPKNYQSVMLQEDAIKRFPFIQSPFLLAMGRLVKEKGFQLLIQAFSEIHENFSELRLVIAGVGPYGNQLKQLTRDLHLENKVIFTGFVQGIERNTLLKHCEIVVIPSLYEPFGIISLEGMVAAKPTIAFKIGGLAEILADNRGILINEATSKCLAEKLHFYLSQPNQMRKVADAGYEAANSIYNLSNLVDETVILYMKMVRT